MLRLWLRCQVPGPSHSVGMTLGMKEGRFGLKGRRAQGEVIAKRIRHPRSLNKL